MRVSLKTGITSRMSRLQEGRFLLDDLARAIRVEQLPHQQVRPDLAPTLLLVGRIGALDVEFPVTHRAHDEARPHVVAAQLLTK